MPRIPRTPGNLLDWRVWVLNAMPAPRTVVNLRALSAWAASEGVPLWLNNWMATSYQGFGGRSINGAGVKAYPNKAAGASATVATLRLSGHNYGPILAAFRDGTHLGNIWGAINRSDWCHGCQGGHYPVVLWQAIGHGGAGSTSGAIVGGGRHGSAPQQIAPPPPRGGFPGSEDSEPLMQRFANLLSADFEGAYQSGRAIRQAVSRPDLPN